MAVGDPYALLVERLSRLFVERHDRAVIAQVTLVFWSQYRDSYVGLDDPDLADGIGTVLQRMPPSRRSPPPPAEPHSAPAAHPQVRLPFDPNQGGMRPP